MKRIKYKHTSYGIGHMPVPVYDSFEECIGFITNAGNEYIFKPAAKHMFLKAAELKEISEHLTKLDNEITRKENK